MHRLFVALRPPPEIRDQLLETMDLVAAARWQDEEQLHLTLRFIGSVERPVAEDVVAALSQVRGPTMSIALSGVGQFERRGRTDALWAGVTPHDALSALNRKIDRALVRTGLEPERRTYLPHVTLARFSRGNGSASEAERWLARHARLTSPVFEIRHFGLYESHLAHEGARYEVVERWALA